MTNEARLQGVQVVGIEQAWLNLASDVLQLAIEEARQKREPHKQELAKTWLLTPAAKLLFDSLLETDIDIEAWIKTGCPRLGKHERTNEPKNAIRGLRRGVTQKTHRPHRKRSDG